MEQENAKFEKNIFQSWSIYSILYSIIYYEFKNSVEMITKGFIQILEEELNMK
jgi:hypothetical protein